MIVRAFLMFASALLLAGCADESDPAVNEVPDPDVRWVDEDPPSVVPARCVAPGPSESLVEPDVDVVERTPWRLIKIGNCRPVEYGTGSDVSFMERWATFPSGCNSQGAAFHVEGRRFKVQPDDVSTTLMDCAPRGPIGNLGAVASWGVAGDGLLYLLDDAGNTVFVVEATGPPGCVASVPGEPNSRRLAEVGDPNCIQS